jgi:hypothetical protein
MTVSLTLGKQGYEFIFGNSMRQAMRPEDQVHFLRKGKAGF